MGELEAEAVVIASEYCSELVEKASVVSSVGGSGEAGSDSVVNPTVVVDWVV